MAEPMLALPYHGPAHHLDVLERLAQRETCRLGLKWPDMSNGERNGWLIWAGAVITAACDLLARDHLTMRLGMVPRRGVGLTMKDFDRMEGWIAARSSDLFIYADRLSGFRDVFEGRNRW